MADNSSPPYSFGIIIPRKPFSRTKSIIFSGITLQSWFIFQASDILHNSVTGPSRNACSSSLNPGFSILMSDFQSGSPENNCPSHHTVPASIASFSVSDKDGSIFLNSEKKGVEIYFCLSGFIDNARFTKASIPSKVMSRPCSE